LVDVAGESRVRITIIEDIATEKIIVRIILLAETMRKKSKIGLAKQDPKNHT
jgi:hypothetical protein